MITRRRLLAILPPSLAALADSLPAQTFFPRKPKPTPAHPLVYIGTDTLKDGAKGIYRARFDPATGQLTTPELAAACVRPSFFALNQVHGRRFLYVCNEGADAPSSTISTFAVDPVTGTLALLGQVSAGGASPCFISVDATGRAAFVANYTGGTVAAFHILPDGRLTAPADVVNFRSDPRLGTPSPQPGPEKERQDGPHPHSATVSPDNRFLVVNDLGDDVIAIFPIDPESAHLGPANLLHTRLPGAGPRHVAFHPNGRWVYGISELNNRVNLYLWNEEHADRDHPAQATLTNANDPISTLMSDYRGHNTAAEIAIDSAGLFLYVSNRGEDSLVAYSINQQDGTLSLLQRISCGGSGPRHFTFDPGQHWILCGNQNSGTVTVLPRDPRTGRISSATLTMPLEAPLFTLFV